MTSYCRTPLTYSAHQKPSVGDSKFSAVTSDHLGWVLCDGRLLSVTQFQFLYNLIGYSFGGSGTQFRLPNARGRVPGAIGTGSDQNNSTFTAILGLSTDEYMHQLTIGEMPSHNHGVSTSGGQVATDSHILYVNLRNALVQLLLMHILLYHNNIISLHIKIQNNEKTSSKSQLKFTCII